MTGLTRNVSEGTAARNDRAPDRAPLTVFCLVIMTKSSQNVDHTGHFDKYIGHLLWMSLFGAVWTEWQILSKRLSATDFPLLLI